MKAEPPTVYYQGAQVVVEDHKPMHLIDEEGDTRPLPDGFKDAFARGRISALSMLHNFVSDPFFLSQPEKVSIQQTLEYSMRPADDPTRIGYEYTMLARLAELQKDGS